jgi:hypothetical protein
MGQKLAIFYMANLATCSRVRAMTEGGLDLELIPGGVDPDAALEAPAEFAVRLLLKQESGGEREAVIAERGAQRGSRRRRKGCYPLSGILFCSACGGRFQGRNLGHGHARYSCSTYRQSKACNAYSIDAQRMERAVLHKLQQAFVLGNHDTLRRKITRRLKQQQKGAQALLDAPTIQRQVNDLERRLSNALDRLVEVEGRAASMLTDKIREWEQDLSKAHERLEEARKSPAAADPKARAEIALGFLDRLESAGLEAEPGDRKALYRTLIARAELEFVTDHPKGRKRPRHRFVGGRLVLTAALALIVGLLAPAQAEAVGFLPSDCSSPEERTSNGWAEALLM